MNKLENCTFKQTGTPAFSLTDCKFKPGEEYRTRDGRRARVYAVDGDIPFPIHGAIYEGAGWCVHVWRPSGRFHTGGVSSKNDLLPPRQKIVRWVNIYNGYCRDHHSKKEADELAMEHRIARKRIEIEYCEGEYDE